MLNSEAMVVHFPAAPIVDVQRIGPLQLASEYVCMMETLRLAKREQARLQVLNSLQAQAASLMGVSTHHIRRIPAAYRQEGAAAITHGNRGRSPATATPDSVIAEVVHRSQNRDWREGIAFPDGEAILHCK